MKENGKGTKKQGKENPGGTRSEEITKETRNQGNKETRRQEYDETEKQALLKIAAREW